MAYSKKYRVSIFRYEVITDYCVNGWLGCLIIAIYNEDWEP